MASLSTIVKGMTRRRLAVLGLAAVAVVASTVYWRPVETSFALDRLLLWWAGFESRYVQLGPHRIHYFAGGQGDPIVFVHGLGARASQWRPVLTGMVEGHRVVALDLLGFGDSDKPEDADYSISQQTEILRQFLDSQEMTKTNLAGWSMGGWVALKFASTSPERVSRLVLTASAGMRFEPSFDVNVLHPDTIEEVGEMLRVLSAPSTPGFIQRDMLRHMKEQNWIVERAINSMLAGRDVLDGRLGNVRMPVLLVWGEKDIVTPITLAESMRFEMPRAALATFAACGHLVPVQCTDEVVRELERFLSQ